MQLSLTVIGPEAQRLGGRATKYWVDAGGTIGRAENSDWMLPDPKQEISRCHARIRFNGNVFYLEDTSANGVFLNDRSNRLDAVTAHKLQDGERIFIGDYQITVSIRDAPAVAARSSSEVGVGADSDKPPPDPLELLGGESATDDHGREPAQPMRRNDAFLQEHFAPPEVRQQVEPPASESASEEGEATEQSQGGGIIPSDWWKQLPAQGADAISPENGELSTPLAGTESPAREPPAERPVPSPGGRGQRGHREEEAVAPASDRQPRRQPNPPSIPREQPAQGAEADVLRALLSGAGVDASRITPELADTLGQLLRVTVEGLMELLRARMEVKNQFRMSVTLIQAEENNPLKFSTNAEDALHNLLVKNNPDYLAPVDAFRSSFEDLRHHQMALLAGMRKAFFAMLDRFDPDELERLFDEKRDSRGVIGKVMHRRNWDLYRELFEDIRRDTESHFNRLFGESFVTAYEKQMDELKVAARQKRRR